MIDFAELREYEKFEDLCQDLLVAQGLTVRRLGRGGGQLGKDMVVEEHLRGPLTDKYSKWLVECKYTHGIGSVSETDVFNVMDRVTAQQADGYALLTNARLTVNLERTLNGLKGQTGISIWTADIIAKMVLINANIYRKYFPASFNRWLHENRLIYVSQVRALKSPLVHVLSHLYLLNNPPKGILDDRARNQLINEMIVVSKELIDKLDNDLLALREQ